MANFYTCDACGALLLDMGTGDVCQNGALQLTKAQKTGENAKTHLPYARVDNGKVVVKIGEQPHPMTEDDYIEWVYVQTSYGGVHCALHPGDEPSVRLNMNPDEVQSVYAYSKAHGLWQAQEPVLPMNFEQNLVACSPEFAVGCVDMTIE